MKTVLDHALRVVDDTAFLMGWRSRGHRVVLFALLILALWLLASQARAEVGVASIYGNNDGFAWRRTASGERMDPGKLTAAHRTLRFGTKVEVTNTRNGRMVEVRVNDRGPFIRGRVIDLSPAGARALGFSGLAPVSLRVMP